MKNYEPSEGLLPSILPYLRPEIAPEKQAEASDHLDQIKAELKTSLKRVGERGYTTVITDPEIRHYGYRKITFIQNDPTEHVSITLQANGVDYKFGLNSDFEVISGKDVNFFLAEQDKVWLELLLLTHLRRALTLEESNLDAELFDPAKQKDRYKKQVSKRGEHLVNLNPRIHKSPGDESKEAYKLSGFAKDPNYETDLDKLNKKWGRNIKGVDSFVTYHRPDSKGRFMETGPVRVALSIRAADEIRSILPIINERSDQEWEDLGKDIFGELYAPI